MYMYCMRQFVLYMYLCACLVCAVPFLGVGPILHMTFDHCIRLAKL